MLTHSLLLKSEKDNFVPPQRTNLDLSFFCVYLVVVLKQESLLPMRCLDFNKTLTLNIKETVHPENRNSVINYLPLCRFKPARLC